jgi:hypothetical protein
MAVKRSIGIVKPSAVTKISTFLAAVKKAKKILVKTAPTPRQDDYIRSTSDPAEQDREMLRTYLALAGIELFQHTNSRTIDGKFDDVSIISIMSERRKDLSAQELIELRQSGILSITVDNDDLLVETDNAIGDGQLYIEVYETVTLIEGV